MEIKCDGCSLVDVNKLKYFQKNLKKISKKEKDKLKKNVEKMGIVYPLYVWNDYVLDGHHRLKIYKELKIERVPVIRVKAKDEETAKKYVMLASSYYGIVTQTGFNTFVENLDTNGLSKLINIAGIDLKIKTTSVAKEKDFRLRLVYNKEDWAELNTYLAPLRESIVYQSDSQLIITALKGAIDGN